MYVVSLWWPEDNSVELGSFELRSPDLCSKCLYPMNQLACLVLIFCWIRIIMALLGSCYSRWGAFGGCRSQVTRPWALYITLTLPVLLPLPASTPWQEGSTPAHLPIEARNPLSFPAFQLLSQVLWAQRMQGIQHKSQAGSVPWYLITHHIWPFCQTGLQNYSKKCKHFHQCDSYHSTKSEESCWWRDQIKEMKGVHSGVQSAKGSPQEKHMKKRL